MPFEAAKESVAVYEQLYSKNPKDPGGETFCGIARKKWPEWGGWKLIDAMKRAGKDITLTDELKQMVDDFYYNNFWLALKCDKIDAVSPTIANELYEASVNCGPSNGVKFLQRALNILNRRGTLYPDLKDDGGIGPKTLGALGQCLKHRPSMLLYKCQNGEQYVYYRNWSLAEDFPGVFNRV